MNLWSRLALGLMLAVAHFSVTGCQTTREAALKEEILGDVPSLTVSRTRTPPVIDGALADPVWSSAATIAGLLPPVMTNHVVSSQPQPTTVRVLWDPQFLYVSFQCVDGDVFCTGTKKHDDLLYQEDVCEVFLDGFGDGRQFIEVQVNPAGVNLDLMYVFTKAAEYTREMRLTQRLCDTDRWKFLEWEMTGLRTAARKTATGWTAELAIPAAAIMKRKGSTIFQPTEIRANFVRYDWPVSKATGQRELLQQNWSPVLVGNPHNAPARMGRLRLVESP